MKKVCLLVAVAIVFTRGGAFAHEGEVHGKKHSDAQMDKFHRMMPMYAQAQAKIKGALEKGDVATVASESEKILATIEDLKKSRPHKNPKHLGTFRKIADAFAADVRATATMARRGDVTGAGAAFRKAEGRCNECHAGFRD
ncbi:cytochrome c [Geobacter sp.]|uniref:cytochrome c n=1 Tax=Geobacter sp. TaxID=46610 RepID=UPI002628A632|nr:cytochrome c [Geobacter sp.]